MTVQMENKLFLDFESFWDTKAGYTLSKKSMSMVEYVRDERFKVFGASVALNDEPVRWVSGKDLAGYFDVIGGSLGEGWDNLAVVCHNTKFDGLILSEIFGVKPKQYVCTKGMSKGVLGKTVKNHSLDTVARHFNMEPKGTMKTDGIRDLTPRQEAELAEYAIHDTELCRAIFKKLSKEFPDNQFAVLHRTIDMFVNPKTVLNVKVLEHANKAEAERRKNIFEKIGIDRKVFSSNKKFPELLKSKGYAVPMKPSPKKKDENGDPVMIPALALGDIGFLELREEGNEELQALCEARIAAKSNLLETRSAKLAAIGKTGTWPFDVEFSGADQTHRFSGGSGAGGNPQNFTRGSALRKAVEVPTGFELVVGDFSKVECVISAFLARDPGLIAALAADPYLNFASNYYGRKLTKKDVEERRFGKEAILGLGYNMGWRKFKDRVKLKTGQSITDEEAKRGVDMYREMYAGIPKLWRFLGNIIPYIASGKKVVWPLPGKLGYQHIELPSGLKLRYPNLRAVPGKRGHDEWVYDVWKKGHLVQAKLYGGKLLENICQALAGELCKEVMMQFGDQVTGQVHDEVHIRCKRGLGLVTKMKLQRLMTLSPDWFPEIQLKAEVGVGPNWLEAK